MRLMTMYRKSLGGASRERHRAVGLRVDWDKGERPVPMVYDQIISSVLLHSTNDPSYSATL